MRLLSQRKVPSILIACDFIVCADKREAEVSLERARKAPSEDALNSCPCYNTCGTCYCCYA